MYLDRRDLTFLRLAGIYRWLPFNSLDRYGFEGLSEDVGLLARFDFLSVARNRKYCQLTAKGYSFLQEHGYPCLLSTHRAYENDPVLRRRLEVTAVALTALRAGIDPLQDHLEALNRQPIFLPAFVLRTGERNLMNAAACVGFGHWETRHTCCSTPGRTIRACISRTS